MTACPRPCCAPAPAVDGVLFAGGVLVVAGRLAVKFAVHVAAPALLVVTVLGWRWFTGNALRPTWSGQRMVRRHVRAAGQCALTLAAVLAVWQPLGLVASLLIVAAISGTVGALVIAAVQLHRAPAPPRALPPRRVRIRVDVPPHRRAAASITKPPPSWKTSTAATTYERRST